MPGQFNRLNYVLGQGAKLRMLFRTDPNASSGTLIVLCGGNMTIERDPDLHDMTESDSIGRYFGHGVENNSIRVDLRRRRDPVSLSALGVLNLYFVDCVAVEIGNTGTSDLYYHMTPGPFSRNAAQVQPISEGFSLIGGLRVAVGVPTPAWAKATEGSGGIPNIGGYYRTGVQIPTDSTYNP